ncbi:TniQ protein [Curtobacterium sp. JUb34]|uniref:TniQ family protein n=1 Tax=Curtobacterium sp. JUb34 TaxID=2485109 RepID=UPI000F46FDE6|nr:TniQ family protein [Curtobacterium sp. JUb34]ROR36642.1 TniQ protein [Curtobacterium sp. JUb34]
MPSRPLAIAPSLAADEWLPSAISRWAWEHFHTTRQALLERLHLHELPPPILRNLGVEAPRPVLTALSAATGITAERLQAATLVPFDGRAIRIANGRVMTDTGWVRRTGTRYCPECFAEQPGVYQRHWRLVWAFVCLRHNRILEDSCPGCTEAPCDVVGATTELWDPSTCRNNISTGKPALRCQARLDYVAESITCDTLSPIAAAQRRIYRIISEDDHPLDALRTIAGIIGNLRAGGDLRLISRLAEAPSETLLGLMEAEARVGSAPPHDAYALAALAAVAVRLLEGPELGVRPFIRKATFTRRPAPVPRSVGFGPGSAAELLAYWGHPNQSMRARVLRAIGADISPRARLRSATNEKPATSPAAPPYAAPGLLWSNWAVPLHIGSGTTMRAMRIAYAQVINDPARHFPTRIVALGDERTRATTTEALTRLWTAAREEPIPINYGQRRRLLNGSTIISLEHWRALCDAANADPGGHRRLTLARWHLYLRATGDDVATLPAAIRGVRRKHDAADLTSFGIRLTAELVDGIDAYLAGLLRSLVSCDPQGACSAQASEPVVWAPPRLSTDAAIGPEIDDIDYESIHAMLSDRTRSLGSIARAVNRTPAHVRLAIDSKPPSSGLASSRIDWCGVLERSEPPAARFVP